ncbi:nucleotide exchange factor GrpE [Candidatus Gottesmanbacteria bacterium RIFCSPHIGHO2_02_FULL_39_11]|uniref:Protein GrpE n=1 Tax=Candidatus Gottesmanbacteria bacterium RIFCSPHIGHO2_02_FULL_39_11 TaxID=1798382 RepID=A0A1F5ZX40_9BACT|nr:MAG: nucleotide exchange factor GrpE [Candidatus Gottesmanbacteria bacterium RIFCSPHIGHO2_02_FULL_39_11]
MDDQKLKSDEIKKGEEKEVKKEVPVEKKEEKPNDLNKKNEELKSESAEWKAKYIRALADYQNLERRIVSQRQEDVLFASKRIILKILDVLDIFESAQKHSEDTNFLIGVNALRQFLKEEGVEKIEVLGKKFDPVIMECVEKMEDAGEIVVEELRNGYTMHGKVIRVAYVKVGKQEMRSEK